MTKAKRFLIVGLPRSGTTYLMTLLNAHPEIFCTGERFNPFGIVGVDTVDRNALNLYARDKSPLAHLDWFFGQHQSAGYAWVGLKYMIGHNTRILSKLADRPDLTLIYIYRQNRLAQVSSLLKAEQDLIWAQTNSDRHQKKKISSDSREICRKWHELETYDVLFQPWFDALPHNKIALEYCELFKPDFNARICSFLGVPPSKRMKSPLVKQGSNRIIDRFEDPQEIEAYFQKIGFAHWLGEEL